MIPHRLRHVEADWTVGTGGQRSTVQRDRIGVLSVQRAVPVGIVPAGGAVRLGPADFIGARPFAVDARLGALAPIVQKLVHVQRLDDPAGIVAGAEIAERHARLLEVLAGFQARVQVGELDHDATVVRGLAAGVARGFEHVVSAGVVECVLLEDVRVLRARVECLIRILPPVLEDQRARLGLNKVLHRLLLKFLDLHLIHIDAERRVGWALAGAQPDARRAGFGGERPPDVREDLVDRGLVSDLIDAPVDRPGVSVGGLAGRIDTQVERQLRLQAAEFVFHPADQ